MEARSYADMASLQQRNWWYVARRELIEHTLRFTGRTFRCVLDLGCGVGSNAVILPPADEQIGVDISTEALAYCRAIEKYTKLIHARAEAVPFCDETVDLVVCADVLEHVDDERTAHEIFRLLRPGGILLATVPAHAYLWNWNDFYGHHLRRYSRTELRRRLEECGFQIRRLFFWNAAFFLPVLIISALQRMRGTPKRLENNLTYLPEWMSRVFLWIVRAERIFGNHLPIGVSLVVLAEKPAEVTTPSIVDTTVGT